MRTSIAMMLALLLVAALGTAWWLGTSTTAATPAPSAPQQEVAAAANVADERAVTTNQTESLDRDSATSGAAGASAAQRPHPEGARWIDLQVVDGNFAPVPNAKVYWHDVETFHLIEADNQLTTTERSIMLRRPCAMAERYGWTTVADENGHARVTGAKGNVVAGKAPGLFGRMTISSRQAASPSGIRLVLAPDTNIRVRVVDHLDQPCANVPIRLLALDEDDDPVDNADWGAMAVTASDGRAELAHAQDYLRSFGERSDVLQIRTFVHLLLPGNRNLGASIDAQNPPTETVIVRMPASGSVRARVEAPEMPHLAGSQLILGDDGQSSFGGFAMSQPADDGWAYFHHVPIGNQLRLFVGGGSSFHKLFDGPRIPDETVDVVVRPAANNILLKLRLVDEDGQPVPKMMFYTEAKGTGIRPIRAAVTDSEGCAILTVRRKPNENEAKIESASITPSSNQEGHGHGTLGPLTLTNGITDLGDVQLRRSPLVASGRILRGKQPCRSRPQIAIERFDPNAPDGRRRLADFYWETTVKIDDDGNFEVFAKLPANHRYRLAVRGSNHAPVTPVPFVPGDTGIIIQVADGHALAATFLLPEGIDPSVLVCRLIPSNAAKQAKLSHRMQGVLEGAVDRRNGEQCDAGWSGVPTGTYTLRVDLWSAGQPLAEVEGIELPLPDAGDPRLVDIDLRDMVQVVMLRLLDPDGAPLKGYGAAFAPAQMAPGKWHGTAIYGSARLLLPKGPIDLQVALEGYEPAPVRGTGTQFDVRLHPWPKVRVRCPHPPDLPTGTSLSMRVEAVQPRQGLWSSISKRGSLQDLLGATTYDTHVQGQTIECAIAEGPYRIRLWLNRATHSFEIQGVLPAQILSTDASVTASIPKATWEAVLAEYRRFIK